MAGPHDPCHIANYFIGYGNENNRPFTPLVIQKLLFFSHGWTLGFYNRPLLNSSFEAWRYGPVMPVIYHNLSYYRADPVAKEILAHEKDFDWQERDILKQVAEKYGVFNGMELSSMTHVEGGPWHQVWSKHRLPLVIPDKLIQEYFSGLAAAHRATSQ